MFSFVVLVHVKEMISIEHLRFQNEDHAFVIRCKMIPYFFRFNC